MATQKKEPPLKGGKRPPLKAKGAPPKKSMWDQLADYQSKYKVDEEPAAKNPVPGAKPVAPPKEVKPAPGLLYRAGAAMRAQPSSIDARVNRAVGRKKKKR